MTKTKKPTSYPHIEFANHLRTLMLARGISQSDLARGVWGTMKDPRGYVVAKNRDRIGHYLSGKSYPERDNRIKIAKVLGIDVDALEKFQPAPVIREAGPAGPNDILVAYYPDGTAAMSMSKVMLSVTTIKLFMDLIEKDPVRKAFRQSADEKTP